MTAYIIVEAEVHDPEKFSAYAKTVLRSWQSLAASTWFWVVSKNHLKVTGAPLG
jgi:uncharacterized protein (DUF1330 family)